MFTTGVSNNRTTSVKRAKCKTMFIPYPSTMFKFKS